MCTKYVFMEQCLSLSVCVCEHIRCVQMEQKRQNNKWKNVIPIVLFSYSHSMDMKRLYRWTVVLYACIYRKAIKSYTYMKRYVNWKKRGMREKWFFPICLDKLAKEGWFSIGYFRHSILTGRCSNTNIFTIFVRIQTQNIIFNYYDGLNFTIFGHSSNGFFECYSYETFKLWISNIFN